MNHLIDETLSKLKNKVDDAEIYLEHEKTISVELLNDKINQAKEEDITGIGIRIIKDQKQGFAYTTNINRLDDAINQAINNSKLNDYDEHICIAENDKKYSKVNGLYDKNLEEITLEESIEFSNELIDYVKESGCNPTSGGYGIGVSSVSIKNSKGIDITESSTICYSSISVNVEDNDTPSSAYYFDASHNHDISSELIASKATQLALASRNAKPTQTRDTNIILDYQAANSLLNPFLSALNSENKQRGRSKFSDKLNQQVTSENFTLTDDGTIDSALKSSICDDEGIPTEKTILIEDGILKSFIYDTYHAKKDESDVFSTANAVRSGYSSVPKVDFTNLELNFKDINTIEDVTEGVFVTSVMGAHTANPITGDFSVEAINAFEIKNGELKTPIKKAMISGNIFEIMENATAATKERRQLSSCILPNIFVDKLRIIG